MSSLFVNCKRVYFTSFSQSVGKVILLLQSVASDGSCGTLFCSGSWFTVIPATQRHSMTTNMYGPTRKTTYNPWWLPQMGEDWGISLQLQNMIKYLGHFCCSSDFLQTWKTLIFTFIHFDSSDAKLWRCLMDEETTSNCFWLRFIKPPEPINTSVTTEFSLVTFS